MARDFGANAAMLALSLWGWRVMRRGEMWIGQVYLISAHPNSEYLRGHISRPFTA
jgi:hypothetical protein